MHVINDVAQCGASDCAIKVRGTWCILICRGIIFKMIYSQSLTTRVITAEIKIDGNASKRPIKI